MHVRRLCGIVCYCPAIYLSYSLIANETHASTYLVIAVRSRDFVRSMTKVSDNDRRGSIVID